MAEETTINYYTHRNPAGHGAAARTRHSTPEFAYNYNQCSHESRPQSILSNYEFGTNALRMKNYIASMHEPITSESPTRARLRVFLRPPRDMRQGENAPELHAIIETSKRIGEPRMGKYSYEKGWSHGLTNTRRPRRFVVARGHRTNSGCSESFQMFLKTRRSITAFFKKSKSNVKLFSSVFWAAWESLKRGYDTFVDGIRHVTGKQKKEL